MARAAADICCFRKPGGMKNATNVREMRKDVAFASCSCDMSERYVEGWKDKSFYMYLELTDAGKLFLKAHAGNMEQEHEYFLDVQEMKYYMKPDHSGQGISISIENGVLKEESDNHLMIYELTDELD